MLERFGNSVALFIFEEFNVSNPRLEINPSDEISEAAN